MAEGSTVRVIERLADEVPRELGASDCRIFLRPAFVLGGGSLLDDVPREDAVLVNATTGKPLIGHLRYAPDEGLTGWALAHHFTLAIANVKDPNVCESGIRAALNRDGRDPATAQPVPPSPKEDFFEVMGDTEAAVVWVPIRARGFWRVLGVLSVVAPPMDETSLNTLLAYVADLADTLGTRVEYDYVLHAMGRFLNAVESRSLREIGELVPASISALVGGAGCSVFIEDPKDPDRITLVATSSHPAGPIDEVAYRRPEKGITPWVYFQSVPAVNIVNVRSKSSIASEVDRLRDELGRELPMPEWSALPAAKACESATPGPLIVVRFGEASERGGVVRVVRNAGSPQFTEEEFRLVKSVTQYLGFTLDVWRGRVAVRAGEDIIGQSPAISAVRDLVQTAASSLLPVLITGENGTGKDLVARAIHRASPRRDGPFLPLNVAELPKELVESELFGHEKGAFTGATSAKIGLFESANGGTFLLDEIGEMSLELQPKLLRAVWEGEIRRVSGTKYIPVDVRIIAATNSDLKALMEAGRFRQDLYYRLGGLPIRVPALRERREDIPLLAKHFLDRFNRKHKRHVRLSEEAVRTLGDYRWPGNVRQLEHTIELLATLTTSDRIERDLVLKSLGEPDAPTPSGDDRQPLAKRIFDVLDETVPADRCLRLADALLRTVEPMQAAVKPHEVRRLIDKSLASTYRALQRLTEARLIRKVGRGYRITMVR